MGCDTQVEMWHERRQMGTKDEILLTRDKNKRQDTETRGKRDDGRERGEGQTRVMCEDHCAQRRLRCVAGQKKIPARHGWQQQKINK